jgi:hypothetical protein
VAKPFFLADGHVVSLNGVYFPAFFPPKILTFSYPPLVEVALKAAAEMKLAQDVPNDAPNGVKRSAEDDDADADEDAHGEVDDEELIVIASHLAYNTRFKGVKRVKMEREGPEVLDRPPQRRRGRPRKSAPAALIQTGTKKTGTADAAAASAQASGSMVDPQQPVKRRRGRPRKNPIPPAPENVAPHKNSPNNSPSSKRSGGPPDSRGRQVFDGVLLPQRPKKALVAVSRSGLSPDHHDPDADADGDMDAEAEAEEGAWVHSSTVQNSELAGTEQGINSFLLRVRLLKKTFFFRCRHRDHPSNFC